MAEKLETFPKYREFHSKILARLGEARKGEQQ